MKLLQSSVVPFAAVLSAIAVVSLLLMAYQVPPIDALRLLFTGALSTPSRMSDMLMLAAPLLLCAIGLTVSFAAGQYNLGIEGQMTIGGVAAMWVMRAYEVGDAVLVFWFGAIVVGVLAGMLWAFLIALLKHYTRVSEIFAGLGLNFVALGTSLYFVFGPWKRPGVASMSGTEPLDESAWLPTLDSTRLAWPTPVIALCVLAFVWWIIRHTHWGLQVRASGLSALASARMGVPAVRRMFEAMAVSGGIAGLAGALQVLGVYHALVPNVASGIGFLGLLVALLARADIRWVAPLAIFFAMVTSGSIQLPLALSTDSSIAGVLQGMLVLAMIIARSVQRRGEA
jgi:simple sugar transport system permease protein